MESPDLDRQLKEENLDPLDWSEFSALAHEALDDAISYTREIRNRSVWRRIPEPVKQELQEKAPDKPQGAAKAYSDFFTRVLPYTYGNSHPRAWGWVIGTGTAQGIVHEMLTAALNANVFGADQSPVYVEQQVLSWFKEKLGYSAEASGLLVSGASTANLVGLAVARTATLGCDVFDNGLQSTPGRFALYCSTEAHNSIAKAISLLGLGRESLCRIGVDQNFQILIPELLARIEQDRRNGILPLCIIGCAGTVNTGAIDDLRELAAICRREHLWFHVDGAFGALLKLSSQLQSLVSGIEEADSLAFDLHKWMHISYDAGCILTRHPHHHRATFSSAASYLEKRARGIGGGNTLFADYGIETSRPFRALKIWLAVKEIGFDRYAQLIEQNVAQARVLANLVRCDHRLNLVATNLNIVCFEFVVPGLPDSDISRLNEELLLRLHETGIAAPSYTSLNGRFVIRVAITNHRTTVADLNLLVAEIVRLGSELEKRL